MITKNKTKLIIKYSAYCLIFIFCVYFFILLFLPYGKIKKAAEETLSAKTGAKVSIARAAYSFPFYVSFSGIKIFNHAGNAAYASIKEVKISLSPYVIAGLMLGSIPVDISIYGVSADSFNAGFVSVPPLSLKYVGFALQAGRDKKTGNVVLTGNISFNGGLTGSISGIDSAFYPNNGILKFNAGALKVKPSAKTAKNLSVIFGTVFKKSGNGYYAYDLKNRIF